MADIFHPPDPPIAGQSISRDVPLARARAFQFSIPLFRGVAEAALYCAHRATTASSWGLCEQEGHLAAPIPSSARAIPSTISFSRVAWSILDCARPTRGVRDRALREHRRHSVQAQVFTPFLHEEWPRLPFTARIERALSECARSASKKGTRPLLTSFPSSPAPQNNAQRPSSRRRPGPSRNTRWAHGSHAQADLIPKIGSAPSRLSAW